MKEGIVRSRVMITRALDRHTCETIADGAFRHKDGVIEDVSTFEQLGRRFPALPVTGSSEDLLIPGLVNAHHHVGLTPFQLGAPDLPLELWAVARSGARDIDPYLDTLVSAFELIASGVTAVQHIHDAVEGDADAVAARLEAVIRAYEHVGMRASVSYGVAEQNFFAHDDEAFLATLPADLAAAARASIDAVKVGADEAIAIFRDLHARFRASRRIRVQLAPANLHWCSDAALVRLAEASERFDVPLHIHLAETPFQRAYAFKRWGVSAFRHLADLGLPSSRLTLGHGVWLEPEDIGALAESGTSICHNCSSNMRLRSGRAPLMAFEASGVNLAIGIDEAGLNDDRDMLQEMRLVLHSHRVPGLGDDVPGVGQIFRMATTGGARTLPFGDLLGELAPGRAADAVLLDWSAITSPHTTADLRAEAVLLHRAKTKHVQTVLCDGEVIYADGRFTRIDAHDILKEVQEAMMRSPRPEEQARHQHAERLITYVQAFWSS